jgi:hypothetical protein
MRLQN